MTAKYKILIKRSAQKELEAIPRKYLPEIVKLIESLAHNPRPANCKKLSYDEKYRVRKGPYRIVYSIQDLELIIWIVKIGHRKEVYR